MKLKLLTATTALSLMAVSGVATAQYNDVDYSTKDEALALSQTADTALEENAYNYEYNRDEQCQGYYWGVKRLGLKNNCETDEEEVLVVEQPAEMEVVKEYVVYFDFDRSNIRDSDMETLNQAANDIAQYNPREVLVVGHTDTSGSVEYNEALSARRANAVSNALTRMNVSNTVVDEMFEGENSPAVPTGDGVKLQENRRVTIQFVR